MNVFCPNCENECSERATACPKCGHPMEMTAGGRFTELPALIAKNRKAMYAWTDEWGRMTVAVGILACLAGFGTCIKGDDPRGWNPTTCMIIFAIGFFLIGFGLIIKMLVVVSKK